ncbi:MAG: DUF2007 domain-containing protein [Opitutae bacterium]|nr:DUF2007 domain-containing protein [Opitutae bacterium]
MSYLETVLTYDRPSEAEVDKAFLESHGIVVFLLNANTARNELGAPFFIRLQVMAEDRERATEILRQANPSRFGSAARVAEIDRQIKHSALWFVLAALPAGFIAYWLIPEPGWKEQIRFDEHQPYDVRPIASAAAAFLAGLIALWLNRRSSGGPAASIAQHSDRPSGGGA